MSIEAAVEFWKDVSQDEELQREVNPASGRVPPMGAQLEAEQLAELAAIAAERGREASPGEFATVESVIRFWEAVAMDPDLQERISPSETLTSVDAAAELVARVASDAGYRFSGPELVAVTNSLGGTGWMSGQESDDDVTGYTTRESSLQLSSPTLQNTAFVGSYSLATSGQLITNFRRIGPGQVAEYM